MGRLRRVIECGDEPGLAEVPAGELGDLALAASLEKLDADPWHVDAVLGTRRHDELGLDLDHSAVGVRDLGAGLGPGEVEARVERVLVPVGDGAVGRSGAGDELAVGGLGIVVERKLRDDLDFGVHTDDLFRILHLLLL